MDFAYPDARIAIEIDGYEYHSDRDPFQKDRTRSNRMGLGEWLVLRYTKDDLTLRPEMVAEELRMALRMRLGRF